jgi:hypothetical protein
MIFLLVGLAPERETSCSSRRNRNVEVQGASLFLLLINLRPLPPLREHFWEQVLQLNELDLANAIHAQSGPEIEARFPAKGFA